MNFHTKHFEAEKCIQKKNSQKKEKTTRNEHSHSKLKNFFIFIFFLQILNLLRLSILGYRMDFEMFSFYTIFLFLKGRAEYCLLFDILIS